MISRRQFWQRGGVILDESIYSLLKKAVEDAYPKEACGLLLGDGESLRVKEIRSMENRAGDDVSGWHYQMEPLEFYQLERRLGQEGLEIFGFYHSHPDAEAVPSAEDEEFAIPGMVYLIFSVFDTGASRARAYQKEFPDESMEELPVKIDTFRNVII